MDLWPKRRTEEEHVERVRQALSTMDRWKPWLLLFWTGTIVLLVWFGTQLFLAAMRVAAVFQQMNAPGAAGFLAGTIFGMVVGGAAYQIGHQWINSLFDDRTARLMVKFYDQLRDSVIDDEATMVGS